MIFVIKAVFVIIERGCVENNANITNKHDIKGYMDPKYLLAYM